MKVRKRRRDSDPKRKGQDTVKPEVDLSADVAAAMAQIQALKLGLDYDHLFVKPEVDDPADSAAPSEPLVTIQTPLNW